MNKRIIELADKAIEDMPGAWNIPDEFCEKFVQLIIQECISKYDEWAEHSTDKTSFHLARHNIKKHFGVDS